MLNCKTDVTMRVLFFKCRFKLIVVSDLPITKHFSEQDNKHPEQKMKTA